MEMAKERGLKGVSKLRKADLVTTLLSVIEKEEAAKSVEEVKVEATKEEVKKEEVKTVAPNNLYNRLEAGRKTRVEASNKLRAILVEAYKNGQAVYFTNKSETLVLKAVKGKVVDGGYIVEALNLITKKTVPFRPTWLANGSMKMVKEEKAKAIYLKLTKLMNTRKASSSAPVKLQKSGRYTVDIVKGNAVVHDHKEGTVNKANLTPLASKILKKFNVNGTVVEVTRKVLTPAQVNALKSYKA